MSNRTMQQTRQLHSQADLLRRRCRSALAKHKARASAADKVLDYGQADLERLASSTSTCCYCKTVLGWSTMTFDHQRPTSRGGAFSLVNVAVCCSRCNALKGVLDVAEFAQLRQLLAHLGPVPRADLETRLLAGGRRYRARG